MSDDKDLQTVINELKNKLPVILFDRTKPSTLSGAITLSETSANFEYLEIYFVTNDGEYGFTKVYNPNGKVIVLEYPKLTTGNCYYKAKLVKISDTTINTYSSLAAEIQLTTGSTPVLSMGDSYIAITRVVGFR